MTRAPETVVIGLNWVGDNILALPTFRALQHRFRNDGGIAVAAPANVGALLAASGVFKQVVCWDKPMRGRIDSLRHRGFKRAVILPNSFRAAAIAFAAGIPERWGYSGNFRAPLLTHRVPRSGVTGHQLDDYTGLLSALSAPRVVDELPVLRLPHQVRDEALARLRALGLGARPIFGLHAGGLYGRAKHWGDERYCELAARLRAAGHDLVLLTSPGEYVQAQAIAAACGGAPIVGHDSDVLHLAAAISHCAAVVTNDSGPLHVAAALGIPTISIFGPTDPGRTVIPGASHVLRRTLDCQPCYKRVCPLGHHACMTGIAVDEVHAAAERLLDDISSRPVAGREVTSTGDVTHRA